MICPACAGRGEYAVGFAAHLRLARCPECHGSGRVPFRRWLALRWEAWREAVYEWLTD